MPKNKINHDVIASKFLPPIVKVSKDKDGEPDGKYPPTMKCKIYCKDDKWGVKLFEMSDPSKTINVNDTDVDSPDIKNVLAGGARIKGIISCVGIWIGSGTFMCRWALSEAQVDVPEGSSSQSQSFVPDSDDEDAEETIVEAATSGAPTEVQTLMMAIAMALKTAMPRHQSPHLHRRRPQRSYGSRRIKCYTLSIK